MTVESFASEVVVEAREVRKGFAGVTVLDGVSLTLRRGRLTALLGENGAGKSTLMNIVAGVLERDGGSLKISGEEVGFLGPRGAQERGIAMIFQELNLLPNMTVAENIFIGREPVNGVGLIDYRKMNAAAAELLKELELEILPTALVGGLRVGQQQVVEIARAVSRVPVVMIMDEPTSALTEHEVEVLFKLIERLKGRGVAIAYITHKLEELTRIAEEAVIMRDGKVVYTGAFAGLTREEIVRHMVGRPAGDFFAKGETTAGEVVLEGRGICLRDAAGRMVVDGVGLTARRGEVLGIFGLMGAGRTELLETLFGVHGKRMTGEILMDGVAVVMGSPAEAIEAGLALVPEDRKRDGLVLLMSVLENASLASLGAATRMGFVVPGQERKHVAGYLERFRVKTASLSQAVRNLSGGNQQKVILAKWLAAKPRVILLDEPTRGIDVGAKREIYGMIEELARQGLAIVMASSELPEVLALSDRVMVMCQGKKTAEFMRGEANEQKVMSAALPRSLAG